MRRRAERRRVLRVEGVRERVANRVGCCNGRQIDLCTREERHGWNGAAWRWRWRSKRAGMLLFAALLLVQGPQGEPGTESERDDGNGHGYGTGMNFVGQIWVMLSSPISNATNHAEEPALPTEPPGI